MTLLINKSLICGHAQLVCISTHPSILCCSIRLPSEHMNTREQVYLVCISSGSKAWCHDHHWSGRKLLHIAFVLFIPRCNQFTKCFIHLFPGDVLLSLNKLDLNSSNVHTILAAITGPMEVRHNIFSTSTWCFKFFKPIWSFFLFTHNSVAEWKTQEITLQLSLKQFCTNIKSEPQNYLV